MSQKKNIGIIGCANIAERFIIPALLNLPTKFSITGIASRDAQKTDAFSKKFNITPFHGYDSLINDTTLNAVYIPLPNSLHTEWIEKSLDKGLHVLVEKSLACTYEDTLRLNIKAKEKNLVLLENFQFRFHNQLTKITELLSNNIIGELRCVRSSFGFPPFADPENIRYKKELGGGALLDAGAYPIKLSQIFLGEELTVEAASLTYNIIKGVDVWGGGFLKQNHGNLFSEIAFGFDNFYQCNLELWGSKGMLFTNRIFTAPAEFGPDLIIKTAKGKEIIKLKADNHFINMLEHFYNLIQNPGSAITEYSQNINQSRLICEFRQKADGE